MRVSIHVRPGSSREIVGGEYDGAIVVRVREAPERGRATEAALRLLAGALGVPRRSVTLVRGASSPRKVVEVDEGADPGVTRRLTAVLDQLRADGPGQGGGSGAARDAGPAGAAGHRGA